VCGRSVWKPTGLGYQYDRICVDSKLTRYFAAGKIDNAVEEFVGYKRCWERMERVILARCSNATRVCHHVTQPSDKYFFADQSVRL